VKQVLLVVFVAVAPAGAEAASLTYIEHPPGVARIWSFYLNIRPDEGPYDTVAFYASSFSSTFLNQNNGLVGGVPRPPGEPFTYWNRNLTRSTAEGGLGWIVLGPVNTPSELSFTGGVLGGTISTAEQPGGNLFLANVQSMSGTVQAQLIRGGELKQTLFTFFPPAEPTSSIIAGLGLVGLIIVRRLRAQR